MSGRISLRESRKHQWNNCGEFVQFVRHRSGRKKFGKEKDSLLLCHTTRLWQLWLLSTKNSRINLIKCICSLYGCNDQNLNHRICIGLREQTVTVLNMQPSRVIWLGNVTQDITERDITQEITQYVPITSIQAVKVCIHSKYRNCP